MMRELIPVISRLSRIFVSLFSTVCNWDCGADVAATNDTVKAIVAFLCAGLAKHIYAE